MTLKEKVFKDAAMRALDIADAQCKNSARLAQILAWGPLAISLAFVACGAYLNLIVAIPAGIWAWWSSRDLKAKVLDVLEASRNLRSALEGMDETA